MAVAAFLILIARFWHPIYGFTSLIELGSVWEGRMIAAFHEYPVFVHPRSSGYDGQYYAQLAHHPSLDARELRPAIDSVPYRARKILVSATAWLLGAGRPDWIIQVYPLINVGCWLVLALLTWRLMNVSGWRSWIAWFGLLFSAGALMSVRFALTDLPAVLLVAAAIYAADRNRPRTAVGWLAAAALTRESSLAAWPVVWTSGDRSWRALLGNGVRMLIAAAPLALWVYYVTWRAGRADLGDGNFAWPLAGLIDGLRDNFSEMATLGSPALVWASVLSIVAVLSQFVFIATRWRPDDVAWRVGAAFAFFMLVLGAQMWAGYPSSAMRFLLPLNLAANLVALRSEAPIGWLLACNLTVFAGVLNLTDVPRDPREVAIARRDGAASVLRLGDGWYGWDFDTEHPWGSTAAPGHLIVRAWPPSAEVGLILTFALQNPTSTVVTIAAGNRLLWRGQLAEGRRVPIALPLTVTAGELDLDMTTDADPAPGGRAPEASLQGLALFEPRLRLISLQDSSGEHRLK